ncbi:MAG: hypothetical protein IMZ53_05700 [Thermoplasmata archaeon]|nr:hypothetical protein [Thermoplasmata archaeon]
MDAAYMLQVKQEFPLAVTNWFYIDLPDVGKGDKAKRTRGEIVEMACKAIMLPELQDALQLLLANNVGAPVVLVRTGYWGRDFGGGQKFFETLKQLLVKLTDLVEPNYERKYVEGRPAPQPSAPDLDDRIRDVENTKYVREHVDKGWTFPRYRSTGKVKDLGRFEALIKEWKNNLRDLLEADIDHISVDFRVEEKSTIEDETQRVSIPLNVPATIQEDAKWFNQINDAHRVKGWADKLLGLDYKDRTVLDTGMIEDLLQQGEQISKIFYTWNPFIDSAAKIKDACSQLGTFLKLLAHANRLIELEKSAERLLVSELSESREVLKKATEEFEFAKNSVGGSSTEVVRAAELDSVIDPLTKKTWLRLLRDAVKKGETEKFHAEVLRGATGLTKDGLCMVLGLKPNADIIDIQNELATNIGHMVGDNNKEFEGQWWQANSPTPVLEYSYRILPQVDRLLQAKLSAQAYDDNIDFKYVFTEFGTIGLYVLAFLGVSLNQANGDTLTAPVFLLKPLLAHVKEALAKWSKKPESRMTSGQLDIVAAGSGGQALYERALLEAGLTPEEVAKLAQFYKMYN